MRPGPGHGQVESVASFMQSVFDGNVASAMKSVPNDVEDNVIVALLDDYRFGVHQGGWTGTIEDRQWDGDTLSVRGYTTSSDGDDFHGSIEIEPAGPNTVRVTFQIPSSGGQWMYFHMVSERGGWKIDNIATEWNRASEPTDSDWKSIDDFWLQFRG